MHIVFVCMVTGTGSAVTFLAKRTNVSFFNLPLGY